ncbi:hypothetical protein HDU86_000779 [Geranomyces michiganensis]|nr:hypothetical protein HDU86_000779 [Geranomyces michiganensis]
MEPHLDPPADTLPRPDAPPTDNENQVQLPQPKRSFSPNAGAASAESDRLAKKSKTDPPAGDIRKFLPNFVPAKLFASRKIEDRGSVFIAHAAEESKRKEERLARGRGNGFQRPYKLIFALSWVRTCRFLDLKPGRTGLAGPDDFHTVSGNDDDGERYGSERMIRLMAKYDAIDVLVVVSRVWGGENLGPVRFTHIENVTHDALKKGGLIGAPSAGAGHVQTASNALLSAYDQEQAVKRLREKDSVIESLRDQLRAAESQSSSPASRPSSQTVMEYGAMTAEKAQRLLKARENTIKLLAKKMDALAE